MDLDDLSKREMARSSDPNYTQTFARVPKTLVAKLKMICFAKGITQSEAIEEAINLWIEQQDVKTLHDQTF